MNPIHVTSGKMNSRGQVIIPKAIRNAFKEVFGTQDSIPLEIMLFPNGTIELVPMSVKNLPVSLFMKSDPELAQSVARAYSNKEAENFATDEQIDNLLKDNNSLSEK
jgi:bifunctional DNA-binding transcriptional regulator/antitoxin component of YhaV-PrlF toxin-antitoxin module